MSHKRCSTVLLEQKFSSFPYVGWDLDGTLLTNRGLGIEPFNYALSEIAGVSGRVQDFRDSGYTDFEIVWEHGITEASVVMEVLHRYSIGLESLYASGSQALPLAMGKALENLASSFQGVRHIVISGNFQPNARLKLKSAGLNKLFPAGQVFGATTKSPSRVSIIERAMREHSIHPQKLLIAGDTMRDYTAARRVGLTVLLYSESGAEQSQLVGVRSHIDSCATDSVVEQRLSEVLASLG